MITKTSTAPLERVKILLQVQAIKKSPSPKYKGIRGTLVTIMKEEGISSLWKGNGANCLRVVPVYALKFTFNDEIKRIVAQGKDIHKLTFKQMILSGSLAGLMQSCIT